MRHVMEFVLGASTCDEVVEGAHLSGHVDELGVYDADCFFVDGFSCGLDGGVVLADCLAKRC